MAVVAGGVQVQDVYLASSFTQGDLRYLKSQFDMISSGKPGIVTATDLVSGMKALDIEGSFTSEEIEGIISRHSLQEQGCLDFEDFLRVQLEFRKTGRSFMRSPSKGDSSFLTSSATTLVHTISDSEKKAYIDHINTYLEDDAVLSKVLPIDPGTNHLFEIVKDGILLCKLINVAVPGTIDERAVNMKGSLNPWERTENHTLCLNSAKAIGCSVVNIGTQDLAEGRPHLVLGLISQIVKIQLLADVNLKKMPELVELLDDSEEFEDFWSLPAEKVLLRWMNFHLKKAGHKKPVTNFSSDIKDGTVYTHLLHQLAPETCSLEPLQIADPIERAKAVLAQAERINCQKYITPKDMVDGSTNLNLPFVAHLFHTRNGLSTDNRKVDYAELLEDAEQDTREERVYRMWINSLGIETFVTSLFEDMRDGLLCSYLHPALGAGEVSGKSLQLVTAVHDEGDGLTLCGWVLLQVLDKVAPGSVAWKCANRPPIQMPFKRVENCNQAVEIGRRLNFSLVNVAGSDIVQGNKKLIVAYLWQLMRYHLLQLPKNLRLQGRQVTDLEILHWANVKVKNSGKSTQMESYRDTTLSSGLFFLDLLGGVEPSVVNWSLVTNGKTEEEKKKNANYIISVARKLGCSIFLLWDDIVEVRPKMILTLTASIMLWSLSHKASKAVEGSFAAN